MKDNEDSESQHDPSVSNVTSKTSVTGVKSNEKVKKSNDKKVIKKNTSTFNVFL